jgi:tetratricopeptide (TPR) repeat protein
MVRLAMHASGSGQHAAAAAAYLQCATAADQRFAYVDAEQAYTAALANLGDDDVGRQDALLARGRVRYCLGRARDALEDLERGRELASRRGDVSAAVASLLDAATILDWSFQVARSASVAEQARELAAGLDDRLLDVRCELARGRTLYRQERLEQAIEVLTWTAAEAAELEDFETHVISLVLLGPALVFAGRVDDAEPVFGSCMSMCERAGDRLHLPPAP